MDHRSHTSLTSAVTCLQARSRPDPSVQHQAEALYCVEVTDASLPLVATLVWTDPPGDPASARVLVHDLDLVVATPVGTEVFNKTTLLGNAVRVDGASVCVCVCVCAKGGVECS